MKNAKFSKLLNIFFFGGGGGEERGGGVRGRSILWKIILRCIVSDYERLTKRKANKSHLLT